MYASYAPTRPPETTAPPPEQFEQWLFQARRGSIAALGRAFAAQRQRLLDVAQRTLDARLKVKIAAEDLVQDTFVEAQCDFAQFRGLREREFRAWLLGILAHRLANSVRRFRRTQQRAIDRERSLEALDPRLERLHDDADSPEAAMLAREEQHRVRAGLEQIREPFRSVLIERTCQGVRFADIAARHGWTVKMARRKWARAARELRQLLAGAA